MVTTRLLIMGYSTKIMSLNVSGMWLHFHLLGWSLPGSVLMRMFSVAILFYENGK